MVVLFLMGAYVVVSAAAWSRYSGDLVLLNTVPALVGALVYWFAQSSLGKAAHRSWYRAGVIAVVVVSWLAFLWVYPRADALRSSGMGSDADDAIAIALTRFFSGENPYGELTYLGNPITPLPGGLLLHAPVYLSGLHPAYTEPLVIALSLLLLWFLDSRLAWPIALGLGGTFAYWQDLLAGSDFVASALLGLVLVVGLLNAEGRHRAIRIALGIGLGIVLATRPTSLLLFLGMFLVLRHLGDRTMALRLTLVPLCTALVITVPFWIANPSEFSPLHVSSKAGGPLSLLIAASLCAAWSVYAVRATARRRFVLSQRFLVLVAPWGFFFAVPASIAQSDFGYLRYSMVTAFALPAAGALLAVVRKQPSDKSAQDGTWT